MLLLFSILLIELYLFAGIFVLRKMGFSFADHAVERQGPLSAREYLIVLSLWPLFLSWLVFTIVWEALRGIKN
jgi:hypothetical protein